MEQATVIDAEFVSAVFPWAANHQPQTATTHLCNGSNCNVTDEPRKKFTRQHGRLFQFSSKLFETFPRRVTVAKLGSISIALALFMCALFCLSTPPGVSGAIACYRCQSRNNSNQNCDDPFHTFNNQSGGHIINFLDRNCMGGRKHREGPFPAVACIKVAGYVLDSGEWLTLRSCAGDSGETTSDTEIVRQNHCGTFRFENEYLKGCIMSCYEDGCNAASSILSSRSKQKATWAFIITVIISATAAAVSTVRISRSFG